MFEMQPKKAELIIVCDDKSQQYGKYLIQLLGKKDDNESSIVGTKDGAVSAAIYTEKEYLDSRSKISSNTHVLFVGNNKTTKEEAKFIDLKINCFGMKFGWMGNRAVMFVDGTIKREEYDAFIQYAQNYQLQYEKKLNGTSRPSGEVAADITKELLLPFIFGPINVYKSIKHIKAKKELQEQQYRCLTLVTYMEGLPSFLDDCAVYTNS